MNENQSQNEDSIDLVALDIFKKLFGIVFNTSDIKDFSDVDLDKFDSEKAILLLFWPLIVAKRYLFPDMELDLFKDILVNQNLDGFLNSLDNIQNSYYLFNEYLDHKDFAKAIENLDMELGYKCIEETRAALKKQKKAHMPTELIQDLLEANKEITLLFSIVQRKHDAHKTREARNFFKENQHMFKILNFDDIQDVDFSSDPNVIRNTRRNIFSSIVKKAGKKLAGYKIAKELGLE